MKIIVCITFVIFSLSACDRYTVTFNDAPVYKPATLFSDYKIVDSALATCLAQTISDKKITKASQLRTLRCSHANIAKLDGLEIFTRLEHLDLADNQLTNINILNQLLNLSLLNVAGNTDLACASLAALTQNIDTIILPAHCITKR